MIPRGPTIPTMEGRLEVAADGTGNEKAEWGELELFDLPRLEHNPAAVYIQHLASPASRRVMRDALNLIATEVLEVPPRFRIGREPAGDADFTASHKHTDNVTYLYCAWSALRHSHTSAVRD